MSNDTKHNWKKSKLGKYFQVKHGYAFKGEFFSNDGPYILLTPGNFKAEGGIILKGEKEKYYMGDFPKEFLLKRKDFLIVLTDLIQNAPILGSPALIMEDNKFLHNQRLGKVVNLNTKEMDKLFLYYLLNTSNVRDQIKGSATGSTVRHTAPERIYAVDVIVPPLPTQHKIAAILSAYDDLIENNTRRIAISEEMAQSLYREWFVHFRFPGHEKNTMVESPLGMIPEVWNVAKVEDVVKRVPVGKQYDNRTVTSRGLIPVLDQGKSGIIGYHDNEPGVCASKDTPIIVFANHTCYQRIIMFPFSAIQNVLPFRPSTPSEYRRNIFWLHWATKDLVKFNDYKGHWPEFMSKGLALPPVELCDLFGSKMEAVVEQIQVLDQKNANLRRTRDLLLPKLISGELDVEGLDIEVGGDGGDASDVEPVPMAESEEATLRQDRFSWHTGDIVFS